MITARLARPLLQPGLLWIIAGAWLLAVLAQATGTGRALHHHDLLDDGLSVPALLLFAMAWQVHIAAMMLPSSLPLIRLFGQASSSQPQSTWVRASFIGAYLLVWTGFGVLALLGDALLHRLVDEWRWLALRPHLIAGSVLVFAGWFQFTDLKQKCLDECRHPAAFLMRYYRRGIRAAFETGRRHAIFCLGCCWALMLLMFAVGITNLLWMAPMALLMLYEKTGSHGGRAVNVAGVSLIALGLVVLVQPDLLPSFLSLTSGSEAALDHTHAPGTPPHLH